MDMRGNLNLKTLKDEFFKCSEEETQFKDRCSRLLVNLQRFEAKSSELAARTQTAHKMKEQYDKYLMQQNPLLWARIQRSIAVVPSLNEIPLMYVDSQKYYDQGDHGQERIQQPVSEPDEESILSSEGAWPHSPSPIIPIDAEPPRQEVTTSKTNATKDHNKPGARLSVPARDERTPSPTHVDEVVDCVIPDLAESEELNFKIPPQAEETPSPAAVKEETPENILVVSASPARSSSASGEESACLRETCHLEDKPADLAPDDTTNDAEKLDHTKPTFAIGLKLDVQEALSPTLTAEVTHPEPSPIEIGEVLVNKPQVPTEPVKPTAEERSPKPFSVDSESEETDVGISGPAQTTAKADDSDSFWE